MHSQIWLNLILGASSSSLWLHHTKLRIKGLCNVTNIVVQPLGHHPQEELAKIGYRSERKPPIAQKTANYRFYSKILKAQQPWHIFFPTKTLQFLGSPSGKVLGLKMTSKPCHLQLKQLGFRVTESIKFVIKDESPSKL